MGGAGPLVAVVDYGLGNLYSIARACGQAGLQANITGDATDLDKADMVLLPGVGAFADAMSALKERGLADALREGAAKGKPMVGICLGLQLMMSVSHEFGTHEGLGLIEGSVERLPENEPDALHGGRRSLKVPQVGWRPIEEPEPGRWDGTPLSGAIPGIYQYFVHSYYVKPSDPSVVGAISHFGGTSFCAAVAKDNIFACQFHPERSGSDGLAIYNNIAKWLSEGGFPQ